MLCSQLVLAGWEHPELWCKWHFGGNHVSPAICAKGGSLLDWLNCRSRPMSPDAASFSGRCSLRDPNGPTESKEEGEEVGQESERCCIDGPHAYRISRQWVMLTVSLFRAQTMALGVKHLARWGVLAIYSKNQTNWFCDQRQLSSRSARHDVGQVLHLWIVIECSAFKFCSNSDS